MSFLSSYAIPAHARREVITHQEDLKDGDKRREGGRREVFSIMNRSALEIQQKCKFNQLSSEGVWLSLFEGSLLLLITLVDVITSINNVWKSV